MYIVPIGFFIIFLISTTTGLLFMFKLRKKNKYNVANGTIALGTGIFCLIACIFFLFFSEIWFPSLTNRALYLKIIELRMQLFFLVKRSSLVQQGTIEIYNKYGVLGNNDTKQI